MKKVVLNSLLVMGLSAGFAYSQAKTQTDAVVNRFKECYNKQENDSIYNMLSPRSQQMLPLEKTRQAMTQLYAQAGDLLSYEFTKQEDKLCYYKTTFKNVKLLLMASLDENNKLDAFRFVPAKDDNVTGGSTKSNMSLPTKTGTLHGYLTLPDRTGKVPVVLIIAGSGPTDMDGNNNAGLKTNAYKMIADSLKAAGIASLRYDKRGVGESAGALKDEASVDFNTYVSDAEDFIQLLKKDTRFSEVIIAGHSEGSLIGMIAARKENVKKYISISGAGECINKTIADQINAQSAEMGEEAMKIMDSLKMGYNVKNVPAELSSLFRPSIQPFMRTWLKYDPQAEIKKLKMPVLIVQGRNDVQVSMKNADNLKKACPNAGLLLLDKMNHVLKDATEDKDNNMATYSNPDLPLSPGLMAGIVKFIKG